MNNFSKWWTQFREVNKSIFRLSLKDFSYFSLLGFLVGAAALYELFSSGYTIFVKFLLASLINDQGLKTNVLANVSAPPAQGIKILFASCLLLALYLVLYCGHAPIAMARIKEAMDIRIAGLEQDKQTLVGKADYRDQLAAAVGVRFVSVAARVQIVNLDGDCRITQEEIFQVSALELHDLVRRRNSRTAEKRETPSIVVSGLEQAGTYRNEIEDEPPARQYHIYFDPPLRNRSQQIRLTIVEDIKKAFIMARDAFPDKWWTKEPKERTAQLIIEPTDDLTLSVDFPLGYDIQDDNFSLTVVYGRTHTRHRLEESRLTGALKIDRLPDGARRATLNIQKPLLGLQYMLAWYPLQGADVKRLTGAGVKGVEGEMAAQGKTV